MVLKRNQTNKLEQLKASGPLRCVYFSLEYTLNENWAKTLE